MEMREHARAAGVLTPHIFDDGSHLNQRETAVVLIKSGLSPLGPLACNTMAPDEGNMYLLGKEGSPELKERFLKLGADAWTLKPEQFDAYIKDEIASNATLVKAAGLSPAP